MADFFQNGCITTLQKVGDRSLESMEKDLKKVSKKRNMVLMLPALYSEFETPAMHGIIEELKQVKYLYKVILGLDRADEKQFKEVKKIMSQLSVPCDVVWNDGPRIQALYDVLRKEKFSSLDVQGKGLNVWTMIGYALTDKDAYAFALHDCDIVNYSREIVARLMYPIVLDGLDFEFNKGYYSRVTHKLHGRVTRLFYTPLIKSIKKVFGDSTYLVYMDSFRYALSGEFAFIRSLARGIRISPTWGLEVSTLSEVYRSTSNKRICQSEIMDTYEHKHQDLGSKDSGGGVMRMANEIAQTIFRVMSQQGVVISSASLQTLLATYFEESRQAIYSYNALAKLNGLEYNRQSEIEAAEIFQEALQLAGETFFQDPMGVPSLSAWITVRSVLPDFSDAFAEAVALDNKE